MKFPFIQNPKTGKPDVMVTLTVAVTSAAVFKFLLDGVTVTLVGHTMDFGHIDAMTYGTLLSPVFAAHSYMHAKGQKEEGVENECKE